VQRCIRERSHILDALLAEGHDVLVIDSLWAHGGGRRENVPDTASFVHMDVRDEGLAGVFDKFKPELVCHHAAQHSVAIGARDPQYDANVNVIGMLNVLEAAVKSGAKKVTFASSAATYGNACIASLGNHAARRCNTDCLSSKNPTTKAPTIAPHGVLELTAIQVAGGAGLLMAAAVFNPGRLRRIDALTRNARRAGTLALGVCLMLACAGLIEGNFSPLKNLPELRLAVGALTMLAFSLGTLPGTCTALRR